MAIESEILCHTLKTAPAIVATGLKLTAKEVARAEFCIPTSMETALHFFIYILCFFIFISFKFKRYTQAVFKVLTS
ncbi:hypothetical protein [Campylobacter cuniculorum]|uniref:Uncharacterized protein n=1 Tax=Campylobacter cuniculorum TaxID=374106 RepID=A0ABX6U1K3_9BACT|nr:hypothetical protein [Campylobacter cuniculorum]QOR04933.1 hypothetical protein A0071_03075 [Campylobacter cuniculorum]